MNVSNVLPFSQRTFSLSSSANQRKKSSSRVITTAEGHNKNNNNNDDDDDNPRTKDARAPWLRTRGQKNVATLTALASDEVTLSSSSRRDERVANEDKRRMSSSGRRSVYDDDESRIATLLDGENARLRVCSDGRVSLFFIGNTKRERDDDCGGGFASNASTYNDNDNKEEEWTLVSTSNVTIPPEANRIGRITKDPARTECMIEFLNEGTNEVLSTLTIRSLTSSPSFEWTRNLKSGFIVDYTVKTCEDNDHSVEMAEIVTDVESSGKWFGGGHFVRQEWPLNGACQEVGPHYPFDFGPHGINTLVSNHWVTTKGLAIVADPETSFFHVGLNAPKENTFFEALTPNGSIRRFHTGVANILRPSALPLTSKMREGDGKLRLQSRSGFCDSKFGAFSHRHPLVGWKSEKTHGFDALIEQNDDISAGVKNIKTQTCSMRVALLAKPNVREATENVLQSMPKPTKCVDTNLIHGPKWSTWGRFKTAVDQEKVLKFADEILDFDFEHSIMEVDDKWSSQYGELEFDKIKFPNPKKMVDELHEKGFKVTLWVTPFVVAGTKAYEEGVKNNYFVKSKVVSPGHVKPGFFSWWQPPPVVAIDLTNKTARDWFLNGLHNLQWRYGIDGFKFDAGEPCFLPKEFETKIPMKHPSEYTKLWSTEIANNFELSEVRSGHHSTDSGVWTRIGDTFSSWTTSNGLRSLIPHMLTSSIGGYPFCLPDMIGGNAYSGGPSRELFVRWAEANCFMPAMQFSIPPWEFGKDVAKATKKVLGTRSKIIKLIEGNARESSETLMPICSPLWWLAPEDENTFDVSDQFCLGNDIVVAPVVHDQQRRRSVYLPEGIWKEFEGTETFKGGQWIEGGYEAGIYEIPAFVRVKT